MWQRCVSRSSKAAVIRSPWKTWCHSLKGKWVDMATFGEAKLAWFRKFLPFEKGIPSHDKFTEVFAGAAKPRQSSSNHLT